MTNTFLDCVHGHLDNRRSDLTEQLYVIARLKRYNLEGLYRNMLEETHRPENIKQALLRDGLPSRQEVEEWLSQYGGRYPDWGRAHAPGAYLVPVIIFAGLVASIIAITGRPYNVFVWLGAILLAPFISLIVRRVRDRRWRLRFVRRLDKEMREQGFNRAHSLVAAMGDFDEFMQSWILVRRVDGDSRTASELAHEALSVWNGES